MKFIAVQVGARRGYAVPAILEREGMLERFYTDVCGSVGMGRAAAGLRRLPGVGRQAQKLYGRQLPAAVASKTSTFGPAALAFAVRSLARDGDAAARDARQQQFDQALGKGMIRAGFGEATHVYSMLGEAAPFLVEAKRRGLTIVTEIYILLSTLRIVAAERRAHPGWEPEEPASLREATEARVREGLLSWTDFFICPSEAVRDDLVANWGVEPGRTGVVPYGMDPTWLDLEPRPIPGRVLFVGTADLRKGIHHLAMAAERLHASGHDFEFRVAGHVTPQIAQHPACRRLKFLGRIPRDRIRQEFQQADVFVLPSLAEGSAEVTYEALAAGVPVVTTHSSGSVVRDGVEGRIVAERDLDAIARALAEIIADRPLRDQLARAARERARDHAWPEYGARLIGVLRSFEHDRSTRVDYAAYP